MSVYKSEDDARPEDSMPPLPQATDEALPDESWPIWECAGSEDPLSRSCVPQETERDVGMEISTESAETHSYAEGTKVILKGLTAPASQRSGWQDFEKLHDIINTGQDTSGPDERAQAQRENHKSGECSDSPVITQDVTSTHVQKTVNTVETIKKPMFWKTNGEEEVQSKDTIGGR